MRLSDFSALTFDCYGTLIDWERGLLAALRPHFGDSPADRALLEAFGRAEMELEIRCPSLPYPEILAGTHRALCREFGAPESQAVAEAFGASVPDWPPFPDTAAALSRLKKRFSLFILSNVDGRSIAGTIGRLGVEFDGVFTAGQIGSYKPDPRNFEFLLSRLGARGLERDSLLHTTQSLAHDIVPAKNAGLAACWIDRRKGQEGWGATAPPSEPARPDFRFPSLGALADAVDAEIERSRFL